MSDVALQSEFSSDRIMPVSWCNPIRSHDGRSGESRSHRGGQGFESPQLHPETAAQWPVWLRRVASASLAPAGMATTDSTSITPESAATLRSTGAVQAGGAVLSRSASADTAGGSARRSVARPRPRSRTSFGSWTPNSTPESVRCTGRVRQTAEEWLAEGLPGRSLKRSRLMQIRWNSCSGRSAGSRSTT
jgi:hypothetical protein